MNSKSIKKLHDKKHRAETGLFLVEGEKNVLELLASDFVIHELYCTGDFAKKYSKAIAAARYARKGAATPILVEGAELSSFGTLSSNNAALAIVLQKHPDSDMSALLRGLLGGKGSFVLALDAISDPGNLGTIVRIADWFGVRDIIAGAGTVDVYNPKTIAATMGSFARVAVHTMALEAFLVAAQKKKIPIIGATLDGATLGTTTLPASGILVMGSESHGIEKSIQKMLSAKITIPRYGKAESLNVAAATAVVLAALRR